MGQQGELELSPLFGEVDVALAPVGRIALPTNEVPRRHGVDGGDRRRLHHADPLAELALGQPVLFPEHPEEVPHADRHAVREDPGLQEARRRTVGHPQELENARVWRELEGH